MNRGEVWQVAFDPTLGEEIQKTRPAVIISRDSLGILALRVVVPLTRWRPEFVGRPWMVRIRPTAANGLTKESAADALQVKSVSALRLRHQMGVVAADMLEQIVRTVGAVIEHS
jgi:mRNA interferase MazF